MDDNYLYSNSAEQDYFINSGSNTTNEVDEIFLQDVIEGLSHSQKSLPCKYFYDETGSRLFEQICQLDEYYITRTELELLENIKQELANEIGENAVIIEPGAGAGKKIQILLHALESPQTYVPMDISKDFLFYSAKVIQENFRNIEVSPIQGDFTKPIKWLDKNSDNRIVFFPGSTIGNFEAELAVSFLQNMKALMGKKGSMIIGVDRIKDRQTLVNAYDDSSGITSDFNKNLLVRINRELNGNFNLNAFQHSAIFNEVDSRIEMHLISTIQQDVRINGHVIRFQKDEAIHTENSHKYSDKSFIKLVSKAGLKSVKYWVDSKNLFNIYYLVPE
ncbi:MAG: L-histidine N(alpha)-methyltransferase [Kangiella sp.]|nr:MAG: L-histidine N(alpha)-methyltransferase [Kangiella sp.]